MKQHFVVLFALVFYSGFSQCEDAEKLDFGGSYSSRTKNNIRFEKKYKDSIYFEDIAYPQEIALIEEYSNFILSKAKTYIVKRGGSDFYQNLNIHGFEVNYEDSVEINYNNPDIYNLSNYNVSYWILYRYKNKNIEYGFGLEFNKKGEMISENKFPEYSKNVKFEKLTNFCDALGLIKKDFRFKNKKVDYIELAYLDGKNTFCWLVEEEKQPNSELGRFQEIKTNMYFVNANSNKLEIVKESRHLSISCGFESFK
ncbi:hypothetical protein [Flavobacterium panacagri]|uniref:hypothetical protein n=1 Tax=Flavobacterium panacagri TaxID=3034146 RepID=UPI0025A577E0|nr:hypothetical protein [Flavobacterium panacagri]